MATTQTAAAPPPPRRIGRRILATAAGLAAVLLIADTLLYQWATTELERAFADWAAARTAQGWTVTADPPQRSGWPLAARITLPNLTISARNPSLPGALDWTADRVILRISLRHPRTLDVAAAGTQHVRVTPMVDFPFTADRFEATIALQPGVPAHATEVEVTELRAGIGNAGLTLGHLHAHGELKPGALQGEPAVALIADLAELVLPARHWALGPAIATASFDLILTGPLPRAETPLTRATAWRDGGGTLELRRATLDWGPLALNGSATVALDERLQPMGAATARITGYAATLDALAAAHLIGAQAATAAKAVLGLMAHAPADGGAPVVEVPLTLQNGALAVGRIPLGRLPELPWPDAP